MPEPARPVGFTHELIVPCIAAPITIPRCSQATSAAVVVILLTLPLPALHIRILFTLPPVCLPYGCQALHDRVHGVRLIVTAVFTFFGLGLAALSAFLVMEVRRGTLQGWCSVLG